MHIPVLLEETVGAILTDPSGIYVDCTLGGGGHSGALAEKLEADGRIIALDKDKEILEKTLKKLNNPKITGYHSDFSSLSKVLHSLNITAVNGIMMDLGVSSFQLDEKERGFSFHYDAPLDMRMNREESFTAADLLQTATEEEISHWLFTYGEERYARSIARRIVNERKEKPLITTTQLAELVKTAVPAAYRRQKHPARKTFQALRIVLNRELEALQQVLPQAVDLLKPGGRLCVITFHSLEDRITKQFMREKTLDCICAPELPVCVCEHRAQLKVIMRRGITPEDREISANPRSRSARLRVAEKL